MKISVDTKEDSPEDIRKVIALLSSLKDRNYSRINRSSSKNIFDDPTLEISSDPGQSNSSSSESSSDAFAGMFGSSSGDQAPSQSASEGVMSMFGSDSDEKDDSSAEEEKEDESIEIIPY